MHFSALAIAATLSALSATVSAAAPPCKKTAYGTLALNDGVSSSLVDIGINNSTGHLAPINSYNTPNTLFDFYACPKNYTGFQGTAGSGGSLVYGFLVPSNVTAFSQCVFGLPTDARPAAATFQIGSCPTAESDVYSVTASDFTLGRTKGKKDGVIKFPGQFPGVPLYNFPAWRYFMLNGEIFAQDGGVNNSTLLLKNVVSVGSLTAGDL